MRNFFVFLATLFLLASCTKSSELFVNVETVGMDWKTEYAKGESPVRLSIFAESQSSVVTRVQVQTYSSDGKINVLMDSVLLSPVKRLNMDFYYTTPSRSDTTKVEIRTTVWTQNGETCPFSLNLFVLPTVTELENYDSKTMYSAASSGPSAFSWNTFEPFYPDSVTKKGYCFYDEFSSDTTTLSCAWSSEILLFARFEGFNYAQATLQSLQEAYENCSPTNRIRNIHDDDVILVGDQTGALGVIKVILVSDKDSVEQDRYIFSLKAKKKAN